MRQTEFWERMREQFGDVYAESVAKDYVLSGLGGRTVSKALADGEDAKAVWRAVSEQFNVPDRLRWRPPTPPQARPKRAASSEQAKGMWHGPPARRPSRQQERG